MICIARTLAIFARPAPVELFGIPKKQSSAPKAILENPRVWTSPWGIGQFSQSLINILHFLFYYSNKYD